MKSLLLAFSFIISAVLSLSAQGNIPQFTHSVTQLVLSPGGALTNVDEIFNYYDSNDHLYQSKANAWDGTGWLLNNRAYYTLNAQGLPTQILYKAWDGATSTLTDSSRVTIGYDGNGQQNFRKEETRNTATNQWVVTFVATSTFTPSNKLLESANEYYDAGTVLYGFRNQYLYDSQDRVSTEIYQNWYNGNWENQLKTDFEYAGNDADYSISTERFWAGDSNDWGVINFRTTQTVTTAQRELVNEYFNGSDWQLNVRTTFKYNPDGQVGIYTVDGWDDATSGWITSSRYYYVYNNDLSIAQLKFYLKENASNNLYLHGVIDYDYNAYLVPTKAPELQAKLSIFPNPTADFIQVAFETNAMSNLSLLDLHGKVVASTTTASNSAQLSLREQPAGTYLLRVEQGGALQVLPVVKR